MPYAVNWIFGWSRVLTAFASGAVIGVGFARDDFLGGYATLRRRLVRLGHNLSRPLACPTSCSPFPRYTARRLRLSRPSPASSEPS